MHQRGSLLITGALGHLGANILTSPLLHLYWHRVVCVDKAEHAPNRLEDIEAQLQCSRDLGHVTQGTDGTQIVWVLQDMVNIDGKGHQGLADLVSAHGITHVINAAAHTHVDRSYVNPTTTTLENMDMVMAMLEASVLHTTLHVTHLSTDEVYGDNVIAQTPRMEGATMEGCSEDSHLQPTNPYSASKASAEMMIGAYAKSYGINWLILRPNNMAGAWQPDKVMAIFARAYIEPVHGHSTQAPVRVHDSGLQVRDYIHTPELVATIFGLAAHRVDGVFNIGHVANENCISVIELAMLVGERVHHAIKSTTQPLSPNSDDTGWKYRPHFIEYIKGRPYNDSRYLTNKTKILKVAQGIASTCPQCQPHVLAALTRNSLQHCVDDAVQHILCTLKMQKKN